MTMHRIPFIGWIAVAFAVVLMFAIASVHHFGINATTFMPAHWWWMDIAGLAVSLSEWIRRDLKRAPAPIPA